MALARTTDPSLLYQSHHSISIPNTPCTAFTMYKHIFLIAVLATSVFARPQNIEQPASKTNVPSSSAYFKRIFQEL